MNGTAANTTPTAPIPAVAAVSSRRRLWSTACTSSTGIARLCRRCSRRLQDAWLAAVNPLVAHSLSSELFTNLHENRYRRSVSQIISRAHYTQIRESLRRGSGVVIAERTRPREFLAKSGGGRPCRRFPRGVVEAGAPGRRDAAPAQRTGIRRAARSRSCVQSFADSVARAAPAVVNIYTARVVTERRQPAPLDQLFGDYWPSYRQRVERSLGRA